MEAAGYLRPPAFHCGISKFLFDEMDLTLNVMILFNALEKIR
ncbi:hypothetical protein EPYR_02792 [Erwinia pyrifoliae DSM 12163]|nr:hypothetical protein EPYR_02792 [Erwinia pyrifoliae DSM 12163]